ncbi:Exonuclease SbcC [Streptomyces misionensis JCM 4497]
MGHGEGRRQRRRARRLHLLLPGRHGHGLPRRTLAAGRERALPGRMGPGRTVVRHLDHLVPARR